MKEFNDLGDFTSEEITSLLQLATRLEQSPEPRALDGKVLALLFMSPSLRTLASFQAGMTRCRSNPQHRRVGRPDRPKNAGTKEPWADTTHSTPLESHILRVKNALLHQIWNSRSDPKDYTN